MVERVEDLAVCWLLLSVVGLAWQLVAVDDSVVRNESTACRRRYRVCAPVQVLRNREVGAHLVGCLLVGDVAERMAKITALGCTIRRCMLLKQAALVLRNDRFSGCSCSLVSLIDYYLLALLTHFSFLYYSK